MRIVIDCSVAACWAIPDEMSAIAERVLLLAAEAEVVVPGVFWYELRNALIVNERRERLTRQETEEGLAAVGLLTPRIDGDFSPPRLMGLARRHRLTVYDASYLELALRSGSDLATLDRRLADAAAMEGVAVLE